jgi:hypothetical protein
VLLVSPETLLPACPAVGSLVLQPPIRVGLFSALRYQERNANCGIRLSFPGTNKSRGPSVNLVGQSAQVPIDPGSARSAADVRVDIVLHFGLEVC